MGALISEQPAAPPLAVKRPEPSLRTNFQWTFAGNVFYAACQWGMLAVLARAGSPAIVGQFALGLAITAPVFMFTNLQLRTVKATDARSEFEFADYFTLRVLASLAGLFVVAAIAVLLPYDQRTRLVIFLIGVSKFVESLSDMVAGLLQKHERLDQAAISLFIRGCLSLAGFGFAFLKAHSLLEAVSALVVAWAAVFLFYDVPNAVPLLDQQRVFICLRPRQLLNLLIGSLPLGVVMTLVSLNVNLPRYVLVKYRGEAELGVFGALAYTLTLVHLLAHALGQSASARLARMFVAGDLGSFRRILNKLFALGGAILVLGSLGAVLFGRPLLRLAYGPVYAQHVDLLVWLTLGAGIAVFGFFLMYGMTAARSFVPQAIAKSVTTLLTLVLCFLLIPHYGAKGAAIAIVASETSFALVLGIALRRPLGIARA